MPNESAEQDQSSLDRRQAQRHEVTRPCRVVRVAEAAGEAAGVTSNVSRTGMLVRFPEVEVTGELPKIGEQARVEIDLPPNPAFSPRVLECQARVVRVGDPSTADTALAFEVLRMEIREGGDPPPPAGPREPLVQ